MRKDIINAIKSPLGFFVLSLLIIEAFICIVLVESDLSQEHKFVGFLIGIAIFVAIVVIVALFAWFKPRNLTYDGYSHLVDSGKIPWGTNSEEISYQDIEKLPASEEKQ